MMRRKSRRGSSLVESTLVLMLLLTLVFSIFDFGWILFEHHTILHRARSAARYGAIKPDDMTAVQNLVLYGQPAAPHGNPPGIFNLDEHTVNSYRADPWTPEDRIMITISDYYYTVITPFMAGKFKGKPIVVSCPVETQ